MIHSHAALLVGAMALMTMILRFLPFVAFRREIPPYVSYLGEVLPPAIIGMLVVYCLKDTSILAAPYGIPELIAVLTVVILHIWKRNNLISIGVGTVLYMVLIQAVF